MVATEPKVSSRLGKHLTIQLHFQPIETASSARDSSEAFQYWPWPLIAAFCPWKNLRLILLCFPVDVNNRSNCPGSPDLKSDTPLIQYCSVSSSGPLTFVIYRIPLLGSTPPLSELTLKSINPRPPSHFPTSPSATPPKIRPEVRSFR